MTTENNTPKPGNYTSRRSGGYVAGIILIVIGLLMLGVRFLEFPGLLFLPALALIFLAWGVITRTTGLLVPGGVLMGIGAGAVLLEVPYQFAAETTRGGIFLLTFAGGWVLISLLSIITESSHRMIIWPLIPASIMAFVGGSLIIGGPALKILELTGNGWPLVLIATGIYLIFRRREACC